MQLRLGLELGLVLGLGIGLGLGLVKVSRTGHTIPDVRCSVSSDFC